MQARGHRSYPQVVRDDTHGNETAMSGQSAFLNITEGMDPAGFPGCLVPHSGSAGEVQAAPEYGSGEGPPGYS